MAVNAPSTTRALPLRSKKAPRELVTATRTGRLYLVWYGDGEPKGAAFEALVEAGLARIGQRDGGSRITTEGVDAWVKGGRLKPKSAGRHLLRRALLKRPFPRLQEASNLAWLRAQGISAARPLLAGLHSVNHWPNAQFLATEFIPDTTPLDALRKRAPQQYPQALAAARALVKSMHRVNFEHRDCYQRNFLIGSGAVAVAIDAWRGGPRRKLSGRCQERDLSDFDCRP